jgi:hypothetical protein
MGQDIVTDGISVRQEWVRRDLGSKNSLCSIWNYELKHNL